MSRRTAVLTAGVLAVALALPLAPAAPAMAASLDDVFAPQAFGVEDHRPAPAPKAARAVFSEKLGVTLGNVPAVTLERLDTEALLQEDQKAAQARPEKILRVGIGRDLQVSALDGNWYALAGGRRLWVGEVASVGALRLRLHFTGVRLPRGAELAVYPVDGDGQKRLNDGAPFFHDAGSAAESFWTPDLAGDRVRVEYIAPRGRKSSELPFHIDNLQHLYLDPAEPSLEGFLKAAGACHNDVTCYSTWASTAKSVARLTFVSGGSTYFCTGQLLNATNSDLTPYFLTANHCISTSTVAATVTAYWFYQTSTCGGAAPSPGSVPQSYGTTLLSTGASSDYTLLMVEGGLPSGVTWSGWTSAAVSNGTASTAIHHPSGDYKRISFGSKSSSTTCGGANHIRVNWSSGVTEGGSSGSGIWRNDTKQLYGQLHCGTSACGNVTNDDYGAFSSTYGSISSYLSGGSDDASENNDTCAAPRAVSTGTLSSRIVKSTDSDWYSISVPAGKKVTVTLSFTHANGDIDTKMYSTCGGAVTASSTGTTGTESMNWTNTGGSAVTVKWQVYLYSDTRNTYSMTVSIV